MIIRQATPKDMSSVYNLTHTMFEKEKYKTSCSRDMSHHPDLDSIPETTVLIVEEDGCVVGTNSITLDGPAGLHVDKDFPEETAQIRLMCKTQLAASWRIVTLSRGSLHIILALIDATLKEGCRQGIGTWLFSFNPRHSRIYTRMLGLEIIAEKHCGSVSAPGILMMGHSEQMTTRWEEFLRGRNVSA